MLVPIDLSENKSFVNTYIPLSELLTKKQQFILLGFEIKNRYDEERLKIHQKLTPTHIVDEQTNTRYYGVICDFDEKHNKLLETIKSLYTNTNAVITEDKFRENTLDLQLYNSMELFFCNTDIPFYQRFSNVNTYIFFK